MTQALSNREIYGPELALQIERMGSIAIAIANRWSMGWPTLTSAHLAAGSFLSALTEQMDREKDVLSEETGMRHLSPREILQAHSVPEAPPPLN